MSKAQEQADIQRAEAKQMLNNALGLPEHITSSAIDRAVDCIISAALIECVLAFQQGLRKENSNEVM